MNNLDLQYLSHNQNYTMEKIIQKQDDRFEVLEKTFRNYKKTPKDRLTSVYTEAKLETLEALWAQFVQDHSLLVSEVGKADREKIEYFSKDRYMQFEECYTIFKSVLKEHLQKNDTSKVVAEKSVQPSTSSCDVKLPRITLPSFSGKYNDWQTFYDMFLSLIHNNEKLSGVQKLHYLKCSLTGEPENLLKNLPTTEANYGEAWKQLTRRYNNKRFNTNEIMKSLFNQKNLTTESSIAIKQLLDTTASCLKSLNNLGIDTSSWDAIVIYLVVSKLDHETRKQWENFVSQETTDESLNWSQLMEFLESRFRMLEMLDNSRNIIKSPQYHTNTKQVPNPKTFHSTVQEKQEKKIMNNTCVMCDGQHMLYQCNQFAKQSPQERSDYVQTKGLCFNCLAPTHSVKACHHSTCCRRCGRRHHSMLHFEREGYQGSTNQTPTNLEREVKQVVRNIRESPSGTETRLVANFSREESPQDKVLLATAIVRIKSRNGYIHNIRALLDQGSQASFVTEETVQLLGLKREPVNGVVSGVGEGETRIKTMVSFVAESRHNPDISIQVNAYVLSTLTSLLPASTITESEWLQIENLPLADPDYGSPGRIDMLLGADIYGDILLDGMIKNPQGPTAQNTLFGWILSGRVRNKSAPVERELISMHIAIKEDRLLKQFWELEHEPDCIEKQLTKEEERCEELFESTTERNEEGRYIVRLPFKDEHPKCQNGRSKDIALRRFNMLEKKLMKNPKLKEEYKKVINEYVELKHMSLITDIEEINYKRAVYLPHHAVVRYDKETTKVRVVFDASCKGVNNKSLNDDLLVGPKLQQDLRHILMRWRYHPICLVADLVKMYRQVLVHKEDTDFQRILWRDDTSGPIQHYRLLTLTFGTASAPYLAVKSLQQLAKDEQSKYPVAAKITLQDYYMDDLMTGCETEDEAKNIYDEMNRLMNAGGFQAQKWCTNNEEILKYIEEERQRTDQSIPLKTNNTVKVLGISWNKTTDNFEYKMNITEEKSNQPITKRRVLSDIARLYDPMGWIAPVVITAKIFIQKLWKSGLSWDDELTPELLREWLLYRNNLVTIERIVIHRWLNTTRKCHVELHVFADASQAAYAAVVYMRVIDQQENVWVSLVTAKTKVSPIEKQVSVPRLELCAAVLASKLIFEVSQVMKVPKKNLYAWSDSTVVLAWLRGFPNRWTTFVSNRVSEILTMLDCDQWRHVSTNFNPADCASRGIHPSELSEHELWWHGPDWLYSPQQKHVEEEYKTHEEEKVTKVLTAIIPGKEEFLWCKFSVLSRMLRVYAYCRRLLNLKIPKDTRPKLPEFVTAEEIDNAFKICVKQTQEFYFKQEIKDLKAENTVAKKSPLHTLNPFFDENGIIRVGGRLHHAQTTHDKRHPIILPPRAHLTKLLVWDAHMRTLHGGPQVMLNYIRSKFWIIRARNEVKKCYKECVKCIRYAKQNNNQLMGQLPEVRLKPSKPFKSTGVDYAGPMNIRFSAGRGSKSFKGYICLFICMVTRAIHLEAVSDLTSQGFISAFRRFVSRRGYCQDLYCDNGTNFVGADKQLRDMFNTANSELSTEIAHLLTLEKTTFHFIPPNSPNFGGLWEAGVRSVKTHLKRVIGDSTLTFEELATVLTQIEACLNSRPLTKLNENTDDLMPLTPGHFLVGEPLLNIPDKDYSDSHVTGLQRWRLVQKMVNDFWKRWSQEYLVSLNQRYKWTRPISEPEINDLVIIKNDNLPPSKWLLGKIVEKHQGKDNLTRVVTIKCEDSLLKRPCNKLCFLPRW